MLPSDVNCDSGSSANCFVCFVHLLAGDLGGHRTLTECLLCVPMRLSSLVSISLRFLSFAVFFYQMLWAENKVKQSGYKYSWFFIA